MQSQPSPQIDPNGSSTGPGAVVGGPGLAWLAGGRPLPNRTGPDRAAGGRAASDEELLAGLRAGDEDSYEFLVRHYGPRMLAVSVRLLRDEDLARDAVQDAFLSAFRSIGRFREGSQLATWLHRITVNAALMRIRHSARRPEVELEELPAIFDADGRSASSGHRPAAEAEARLLQEETRQRVRRSIDRLPSTYRTVLLLRDIEELETSQVAAALGISANAVKIRLHRARQALARVLAEAAPGHSGGSGERAARRRRCTSSATNSSGSSTGAELR